MDCPWWGIVGGCYNVSRGTCSNAPWRRLQQIQNHFGLANFCFINLPLELFNFNFIWFFPKKKFLILNLEEKNVAGRREKKIFRLDIFTKFSDPIGLQPTASIPFGHMADLELGSDVWSQAVVLGKLGTRILIHMDYTRVSFLDDLILWN
jgi:hypothetical protein